MTERLLGDAAGIARAAAELRRGGLVAFPTETVYGLGARADDARAVARIFEAKGRAATNPLIVHVAEIDGARGLADAWPPLAESLARAFWPGPLTLVVARRAGAVADAVVAGGSTVAIRVPAHPVAHAVLAACALPIAAPSANRSTSVSPTTAAHVLKTLDGRIDLVLDGGPTGHGIESTIVDVSVAPALLLRHGAIPLSRIAEHGTVVDRSGAIFAAGERAPSPGTSARHYAPRARLAILPRGSLSSASQDGQARGERVGAILRRADVVAAFAEGSEAPSPALVLPDDPEGYAAELYAALHQLDDRGCDAILVAEVPADPGWAAIRDRLRRGSA